MSRLPLHRSLPALPKHILPTSGSLVGSMLVTGLLGFIYWLVAARFFSPGDVGLAAAVISAMIFLAIFAMLGLGTLIVREAPRFPGQQLALIGTGVAAAGLLGVVLGLAFALLAPMAAYSLRDLSINLQNAVAFAFGVGLTTSVMVLDQCLIGLMRGDLQLVRNGIFAVIKLVAVLIAGLFYGHHSGMLILLTWIVGDVVSVLVLGAYAARRGALGRALPRAWSTLGRVLPHAAGHHMLNVGLLAPSWALPVIVTAILSAERNASFFVAQLITGPGLFIPGALAFTLFAVAARSPEELHHKVRTTLALSFGASIAAAIGVLLLGRFILGLFGRTYVEEGTLALFALTLIMFPLTVKVHFANLRRLEGRMVTGSIFILGGALLELGFAAAGAIVAGINGVAFGVLIATSIQAIGMAPTVIRAARDDGPEIVHAAGGPVADLS